jgi:hypothetical protein
MAAEVPGSRSTKRDFLGELKNAGRTVIDATKTSVDTFLADRVRPKWGTYRSLGDTSGFLQDCYMLLTNMRGYQGVTS